VFHAREPILADDVGLRVKISRYMYPTSVADSAADASLLALEGAVYNIVSALGTALVDSAVNLSSLHIAS